MAGPGLMLTSPVSRTIMASLNVGLQEGIGSNIKQRLRHGKPCKKGKRMMYSHLLGEMLR